MAKLGRPRTIPDVDCGFCGETFHPTERGARFCSRLCYFAWKVGQPGNRVAPAVKKCLACDREFAVGGTGRPRRQQVYCSLACAGRSKDGPPREMADIEAAWLAGVFDGEGCISQPQKDRADSLRLTITNSHYALLERIVEVAGVGKIIDHKAATDRHAQTWNWQCYADNGRDVLEQLLPWLIVKRERAEVAIAARRAPRNTRKG